MLKCIICSYCFAVSLPVFSLLKFALLPCLSSWSLFFIFIVIDYPHLFLVSLLLSCVYIPLCFRSLLSVEVCIQNRILPYNIVVEKQYVAKEVSVNSQYSKKNRKK